jgi:hypothetical protein
LKKERSEETEMKEDNKCHGNSETEGEQNSDMEVQYVGVAMSILL